MHLGLYHEPVHTDGVGFDTYGPYARYVLAFAQRFEHVTVLAPTTDKPTYFSGCKLDAPNVTVAPLPFFQTHVEAAAQLGAIINTFRRHAGTLDAVNARGTAPFAYILWLMTRRRGAPFVYHFASDPFEVIARNPKYAGLRGHFARSAYGVEFAIQKYIMRRNYAFASGRAIYERLRRFTTNVEAVVDSTLTEQDYYLRDDCCTGPVVRILYVGYLRHGKGLEDLIDALARLTTAGRNVQLDLVGSGQMHPVLQARARELGIAERVCFHGHVIMGPALNEHYNRADVFALPSLSEGSPRVVLEALGHSLPVIATDVGNIAEMLDGGRRGLLVPRNDPAAIAAAVERLIDEPQLRRRCIREGYAYARQRSLDAFVGRMADKIRQMVLDRRKAPSP